MTRFFFDEAQSLAHLPDKSFLELIFREIQIVGDGLDVLFVDPDISFAGAGTAISALVAVKSQACLVPFWFFHEWFYFRDPLKIQPLHSETSIVSPSLTVGVR